MRFSKTGPASSLKSYYLILFAMQVHKMVSWYIFSFHFITSNLVSFLLENYLLRKEISTSVNTYIALSVYKKYLKWREGSWLPPRTFSCWHSSERQHRKQTEQAQAWVLAKLDRGLSLCSWKTTADSQPPLPLPVPPWSLVSLFCSVLRLGDNSLLLNSEALTISMLTTSPSRVT